MKPHAFFLDFVVVGIDADRESGAPVSSRGNHPVDPRLQTNDLEGALVIAAGGRDNGGVPYEVDLHLCRNQCPGRKELTHSFFVYIGVYRALLPISKPRVNTS